MTDQPPADSAAPSARDRLLDRTLLFFAEQGVADASLRGIAAGVGTSHRMLLHHFGSRAGLLRAVVQRLESDQRRLLHDLVAEAETRPGEDPAVVSWAFWTLTADATLVYGPLFYELAAHAMQGREHAQSLRHSLIEDWVDPLAGLWTRAGLDPATARRQARLDLAVARGLLQDLLLTGDRAAVDRAMRDYLDAVTAAPGRLAPRR